MRVSRIRRAEPMVERLRGRSPTIGPSNLRKSDRDSCNLSRSGAVNPWRFFGANEGLLVSLVLCALISPALSGPLSTGNRQGQSTSEVAQQKIEAPNTKAGEKGALYLEGKWEYGRNFGSAGPSGLSGRITMSSKLPQPAANSEESLSQKTSWTTYDRTTGMAGTLPRAMGRLGANEKADQKTCDQASSDYRHFQVANVPSEGVRCWRHIRPKHLYVLAGIVRAKGAA
jgi:hypothetical protein